MKKPKSNTKTRIETDEQAQEFVAQKMRKILFDCIDSKINHAFACQLILVMATETIIATGDADAFQDIINQIFDKHKDTLGMNKTDTDDDGTFH